MPCPRASGLSIGASGCPSLEHLGMSRADAEGLVKSRYSPPHFFQRVLEQSPEAFRRGGLADRCDRCALGDPCLHVLGDQKRLVNSHAAVIAGPAAAIASGAAAELPRRGIRARGAGQTP